MTNDVQSPAMGKAGTDPYASMVSRLQKTMPAHVDGQLSTIIEQKLKAKQNNSKLTKPKLQSLKSY
eukprot:jgi/Pico_ML_1/56038/g1636.t1